MEGPEVQKEGARRPHARPARPGAAGAGAGEPARCLGVGRGLRARRLLYLRAGGKFGGSGVIGLTWGGGTFRSFIGKFPLSSPLPRPGPPSSGSNNSSSEPFKTDLARAAGPCARLPRPASSPPPLEAMRGDFLPRPSSRPAPPAPPQPNAAPQTGGGACPGRCPPTQCPVGGGGCDSSSGQRLRRTG